MNAVMPPLVENLRAMGHNVLYIVEESPGITDSRVLAKAYAENRILITEDKDFGELVYRLQKEAKQVSFFSDFRHPKPN